MSRTTTPVYRVPLEIVNLGITNYWDFGTGYANLNSPIVADRIDNLDVQWRGSAAVGGAYTTGEFSADFEAANLDEVFTSNDKKLSASAITALTVFGWVKQETVGSGLVRNIISHWVGATNQRSFLIELDNLDKLRTFINSTGAAVNSTYTSDAAFSADLDWHFAVATFTASAAMSMYKDGVPFASSLTAGSNIASIFAATTTFEIGQNVSLTRRFDGKIGICGIAVGKTMSDAEIATLYELTNKIGNYR